MQKMETRPVISHPVQKSTPNESKLIRALNVSPETLKLLQENTRRYMQWPLFSE
jgi:hypothetical protein